MLWQALRPRVTQWTYDGCVLVSDLDYAAFASQARGLMLPRYECLRL